MGDALFWLCIWMSSERTIGQISWKKGIPQTNQATPGFKHLTSAADCLPARRSEHRGCDVVGCMSHQLCDSSFTLAAENYF